MVIRVHVNGLKELNKYLVDLPEKVDKELTNGNELFMKKVQKSAKLRAPRDTGRLAESIHMVKTKVKGRSKQWSLVADAPWARAQELGFKPHAFLPGGPGFASNKITGNRPVFVKKSTPFLVPALDANINSLDSMMQSGLRRALK